MSGPARSRAQRVSTAAGAPPRPLESLAVAMHRLTLDFWSLLFAKDDAERGELIASMSHNTTLLQSELAFALGWLIERRNRAMARKGAPQRVSAGRAADVGGEAAGGDQAASRE